ncbi:MAG: hypothetical protein JWN21_498 [Sphingomonas bacterium]|uniref:hypothetical protein n=1 Tax=Sphingomonas bacterium TaxID=1895847 RepID=UPI002625D8FE|nr:hypothetical protein [Sphingomonas bacterium]MDB5694955.1 hypothetical protein [Sphingomonas bacterium]
MTDPTRADISLDSLSELPIQPTGSGVADLEIAYEQMKLAEDAGSPPGNADMTGQLAAGDQSRAQLPPGEIEVESAAHPS